MKLYCCKEYADELTMNSSTIDLVIVTNSVRSKIEIKHGTRIFGCYIKHQTANTFITSLRGKNSNGRSCERDLEINAEFSASVTSYKCLFIPTTLQEFYYFVEENTITYL